MTAGRAQDPRTTFSGSARRYLESSDHGTGPDLALIRKVAEEIFPALTVDVATGAGHALRAAAPVSGRCLALDLTREMLRVACEHLSGVGIGDVAAVQASAERLPLRDLSVQLLTCRIAPHHFPSLSPFLREVCRVLAHHGRAVIIDSVVPGEAQYDRFLNEVERLRDPSHVRSHTGAEWDEQIAGAGLEILYHETFSRTHPFQEWARRVGLGEQEVLLLEKRFLEASPDIRRQFDVRVVDGRVESYVDEKGVWVLKRQNSESRIQNPE